MSIKKILLIVSVIAAIVVVYFLLPTSDDSNQIMTEVKQGEFVISVSTSGDLFAKNSTKIMGPNSLSSVGIYNNLKLNHIIDEGTLVDSGDYIAKLDPNPILDKLKNVDASLEKLTASINRSKLDSALTLRAARDMLVNQRYAIEEMELDLKNSKYETPVTIKKLKIKIAKSERTYKQAVNNYYLKKDKQENIVRTAIIDFQKVNSKREKLLEVLQQFEIRAPQSGILVYYRSWRGKVKAGATISMWNPVIALLPDLSIMNIKTYVNEIDISKIKVGQNVEIGIDAFPSKRLKGEVISVANIGEELEATSAHVFEVIVEVEGQDSDLRPAMTTKNKIIIETLDSVMYIPIECINTEDSITFVYCDGDKKEVKAGRSNQDEIIIEEGLEFEQKIYLVPPEGADKWSIDRL